MYEPIVGNQHTRQSAHQLSGLDCTRSLTSCCILPLVYMKYIFLSITPMLEQGKWLLFGGCVAVIIIVGLTVPPYLMSAQRET